MTQTLRFTLALLLWLAAIACNKSPLSEVTGPTGLSVPSGPANSLTWSTKDPNLRPPYASGQQARIDLLAPSTDGYQIRSERENGSTNLWEDKTSEMPFRRTGPTRYEHSGTQTGKWRFSVCKTQCEDQENWSQWSNEYTVDDGTPRASDPAPSPGPGPGPSPTPPPVVVPPDPGPGPVEPPVKTYSYFQMRLIGFPAHWVYNCTREPGNGVYLGLWQINGRNYLRVCRIEGETTITEFPNHSTIPGQLLADYLDSF